MNKLEVQQRVLQNGKPLDLDKFSWDEKTKTFSSNEDCLVIDFNNVNNCTIKAGYSATIKAGDSATIKAGDSATIKAGYYATIKAGDSATIKAGDSATIKAGDYATIDAGDLSIIIYRKDGKLYSIETEKDKTYQTTIYDDDHSFLINGVSEKDGKPYILADGILSQVISKKGNIYKVINNGQTEANFIIKQGDIYSHGATLKEAKESLVYKISNRDTSKYDDLTVSSVLTKEEAIQCYRCITGACEYGTRMFVESLDNVPKSITINELIELTSNNYGNDIFKQFFNK